MLIKSDEIVDLSTVHRLTETHLQTHKKYHNKEINSIMYGDEFPYGIASEPQLIEMKDIKWRGGKFQTYQTRFGNGNPQQKEISNSIHTQGLKLKSPGLSFYLAGSSNKVAYTTNASGITTMEVTNPAVRSGTETLTIYGINKNLITQPESSHVVENLTWNTTDPIITASSADDISDIEVGMIITGEAFGGAMKVRAINGAVITFGDAGGGGGLATLASGAVTSNEATFIQYRRRISDTWSKYKSATPSENNNDDYEDDTYWPASGQRYGLEPSHAQINGSFFIDCDKGMIHFSSNLSGKDIILKYISDSLGKHDEMLVHKFAEEAIYKWIAYGCLIATLGIPEYVIQRFKKEKFAETRKAKLRLSNIKLEEITQTLRGKSKQIKH